MSFDRSFYPRRLCDFQRISEEKKRSNLLKDMSLFKWASAPIYGGDYSVFSYKKRSKSDQDKIYYGSNHCPNEYMALEIFNYLGIHAPKCRFGMQPYSARNMVKAVPKYIPIMAIDRDKPLPPLSRTLLDFRRRYHLNAVTQYVIDLTQNKKYKISGNLFATDIAGLMTHDFDFICGFNLGVVRIRNRFYAAAIDKDRANFGGYSHDQLTAFMRNQIKNNLFRYRTLDQELIIVSKIAAGLKEDEKGVCDFDRIFDNERVNTTFVLDEVAKKRENFKATAKSFLEYYERKYGSNFLVAFSQREKIREFIADKIARLPKFHDTDLRDLKQIIIEDLRAPYYTDYFEDKERKLLSAADLHNLGLLNAIMVDLDNEFEFAPTKRLFARL